MWHGSVAVNHWALINLKPQGYGIAIPFSIPGIPPAGPVDH
jgi:hypothetical protein